MFNFPFFGFPPYYNYKKYNNYNNYNNYGNYNNSINPEKNSITNFKEKISNTIDSNIISNLNGEQALFEIFGIKLYLDDIIIICILYFLYKQEVKDEILYIILFLLLFS